MIICQKCNRKYTFDEWLARGENNCFDCSGGYDTPLNTDCIVPKSVLSENPPALYVRRIDDLGRVVIPKVIRKLAAIEEGDEMQISYNDGTIIVEKVDSNETD